MEHFERFVSRLSVLRSANIGIKINGVVLIGLVLLSLILTIISIRAAKHEAEKSIENFREVVFKEKQEKVKAAVDLTIGFLVEQAKFVDEGVLSEEQIRNRAKEIIGTFR